MTSTEFLARCDKHIRPLASRFLPPAVTVALYSKTRAYYLKKLTCDIPLAVMPPQELERTLWGLTFRSPILNAAGMFKNGEGYQYCAAQGAGAYLSGTTTGPARRGNSKQGVYLPFAPYPRSLASSNWLGLPNDGDKAVAARLANVSRVSNCPLGVSIMGSPDLDGELKLETLVEGLFHYQRAGVDFIEINESCPNTEDGPPQENELYARLLTIKDSFLAKRTRSLPLVVKFSLDTDPAQIADLCAMLIELDFDGITLGNTSTRYEQHRSSIHKDEQNLYDYFTSTFGGGLGGEIVSKDAIALVQAASSAVESQNLNREFHIIRTGGVCSAHDVDESLKNGASLVQWYTGYFEAFAEHGHEVYRTLYADLLRLAD